MEIRVKEVKLNATLLLIQASVLNQNPKLKGLICKCMNHN